MIPAANADEGVSVAVAPETLIDAATFDDAPAARSVNVEEVNVELFIAWLKVTETLVPVETPVAPDAGDWLRIPGGPVVMTIRIAVALCVSEPLVAVIVRFEDPVVLPAVMLSVADPDPPAMVTLGENELVSPPGNPLKLS